jgi:hypothetical protein
MYTENILGISSTTYLEEFPEESSGFMTYILTNSGKEMKYIFTFMDSLVDGPVLRTKIQNSS